MYRGSESVWTYGMIPAKFTKLRTGGANYSRILEVDGCSDGENCW